MSWLRFNMSQSGSSHLELDAIKPPPTSSKPVLKIKPTAKTVNVNSNFCYIEQQIKENVTQIVKDLQTKYKLQDLFITYRKKKKPSKADRI